MPTFSVAAAQGCFPPIHDPVPRQPDQLETNEQGLVLFYLVLRSTSHGGGVYFKRYAPSFFSLCISLTGSLSCRAAIPPYAPIITLTSLAEAFRLWDSHCLSTHVHHAHGDARTASASFSFLELNPPSSSAPSSSSRAPPIF